MLPEGIYLPHEIEQYDYLKIYIDTIYKKSKFIDKHIEIEKCPEDNCYQMFMCNSGKINSIGNNKTPWDCICYLITFNQQNKFVHGEIFFNEFKYISHNQNEFNGMCDKFVKWSNNLYGLIDKMTNEIKEEIVC